MEYKVRTKPNELVCLEILNRRLDLSSNDRQHYYNWKKGYEGERLFDSFTKNIQNDCLIINDLRLTMNQSTFQIDTLLLIHDQIYLYEIKNYSGDYYYEADKIYTKQSNIEIINPLYQLNRSEAMLHRLLQELGSPLPITALLVFINPSFMLYQAPLNKPIIYPTQLKNHLHQLSETPSKITKKHQRLADKIISLHESTSPHTQIPAYHYNELKKGVTCHKCYSYSLVLRRTTCRCQKCGYIEKVSKAILRTIKEFQLLFPNEKLTTNRIHDWCRLGSKEWIRKILSKHFKKVGAHRWTYYE